MAGAALKRLMAEYKRKNLIRKILSVRILGILYRLYNGCVMALLGLASIIFAESFLQDLAILISR